MADQKKAPQLRIVGQHESAPRKHWLEIFAENPAEIGKGILFALCGLAITLIAISFVIITLKGDLNFKNAGVVSVISGAILLIRKMVVPMLKRKDE